MTRPSEVAGMGQVQAARMLSRAVVGALEAADSSGRALTELQKGALVEAALLAFDGYKAETLGLMATDDRIRAAVATVEDRADTDEPVRWLRGGYTA